MKQRPKFMKGQVLFDWFENNYIEKNEETGCWIWLGSSSNGYGQTIIEGNYERTHRAFAIHYKGPVPDGLVVGHACDEPLCCNPKHLVYETRSESKKRTHKLLQKKTGLKYPKSIFTKEDDDEINRLRIEGVKVNDIAKKYSVTYGTIYKRLNEENRKRHLSEDSIYEIFELRIKGLSLNQIKKIFGVDESTISLILSGKRHGNIYDKYKHRLNWKKPKKIVNDYWHMLMKKRIIEWTHIKIEDLGKMLGQSRTVVCQIRNGNIWKNVKYE